MARPALVWHLFRRTAHLQRKRMAMTVAAIAWGTISIVLLLSFMRAEATCAEPPQHGRGSWSSAGADQHGLRRLPQGPNTRALDMPLSANIPSSRWPAPDAG
jgi:hypothetical protein